MPGVPSAPHIRGWRPDPTDFRDYPFPEPPALFVSLLPKRSSLRRFMPPVEDQGQIGSCTANASVAMIEYLERRRYGLHTDLSRLFTYYNARKYGGNVGEDTGAHIRDALRSLVHEGAAEELLWPYDPARFAQEPPPTAYSDATDRQARVYYRVRSLQELKVSIAWLRTPVVFGMLCYDSMWRPSGDLEPPSAGHNEKPNGAHAILAVGYDDARQRVIFRNSWGGWWGDQGYGSLPYEFVSNPAECWDFWTIRSSELKPSIQSYVKQAFQALRGKPL